ncbi:MAG: redoxin domain-containing protein [Flavobacteriales bacterium]
MKNLVLSFLIIAAFSTQAQDHNIKGNIKGINPTDTVYLAQYLGKSLFYNDTAIVASDGYFTFQGKPYEEGGKYAVVTPGPKLLEILVDDRELEFQSDQENLDFNMKVVKSKNNKIFYDYKQFIGGKNTERGPLDTVINDSLSTEKEIEDSRKKLRKLTEEVIEYQKQLVVEHESELVGKIIKMTMDVQVPEAPEGVENEREWRYRYYREHYWDNTDLTDPRLVREQTYHRLLEKYLTQVIPQIPDSVFIEGSKLVEKVSENYDMYKYTLHQLTYLTETSKVMCMDKAFVMTVNKYYKTGKADWLTEEKLANIIEGADKKANTLCGEVAPNIILPNIEDDGWVNMHQIDADYTIIAIWEPSCGHCKKEMPKLQDVYAKYKDQGVKIFGINNDLENKDWKEFVTEKGLGDWINVSDNPAVNNSDSARTLIIEGITTLNSLNYRSIYDVTSTPKIYLLDENKEIIAKQLTSEQLDGMLENFLNKETETQIQEDLDQGLLNEENATEKRKRKTK